MQSWQRWREPLAVVLLVALAGMLVVRGIGLALVLDAGYTGGLWGGLPGGDDLLLLATAGAVLWCATPLAATGDDGVQQRAASPHAGPITVAGSVVIAVTVLGRLVLTVWDAVTVVSVPTPDVGFVLVVVEALLRLAVPVAALGAAVLAVRWVVIADHAADARRSAQPAAPTADAADAEAGTATPERLPAAWQADQATGAVWLTADDAAQGRPGLSWSEPTESVHRTASGEWTPATSGQADQESASGPRPRSAAEDDDLR